MNVTAKLLLGNSSLTVAACACKERLNVGMELLSKAGKQMSISVSKVQSKGHIAVVDSNGGCIIPYNNALAREIQHYVQNEIVNECCKLYTKTTHILNYRTRDFFSRGSRLSQGTSLCLWLMKQSSSHLARHVSCAVVVVPLLDLFCTFHALPNRLP